MIVSSSAQWHLSRYEDMLHDRRPVEEWWQDISENVVPRKSYVTESHDFIDDSRHRRLYDTTAIDAAQTLGNGHSSFITPAEQRWFYWGAPDHLKTDEHEEWYRRASLIAAVELAGSNFYTQSSECYLDRSSFGIANISAWPGRRTALNFKVHPVNSYVIDEGDEGIVEELAFVYEQGISQHVKMLGKETCMKSEKMRNALQKLEQNGTNTRLRVLHHVWPRDDSKRDVMSKEGKHLPIGSVYICMDDKTLLHEGGFEEQPYTCSRYLKHTSRGAQYGYSPAWRAMPAIRQVNFLQMSLDLVAEKQATPPVLIPDYLEGEVDLRAGGATMFQASRVKGSYGLPQEWANSGRYEIGVDRVREKQQEINRAFHVDLFRMFAEMDRNAQMTAREVAERSSEKLIQFSPSFTRFTSDFEVCMTRVFNVLLRQGKFPPPPPGLIYLDQKTGRPNVPTPKVIYQSKIALAIQQLQNSGVDRLMERALAVGELAPEVFDNFDLDATVRVIGRNDGVPEEVFRPQKEVDAIRQARQEAQEQAAQMEQLQQGADAAGKVGMKVE